ncbi:hypothetical protein [Candidatus Paracaedibacter symbiosus]|uniref:hypothetical protein n=1 Tax=Candidatus Paracaedibacter symbiosus TaxID=244582 RepID=UPI0012EB96BD|nr:hypothetical protein [Candidatus Paracaedibacter symbiosus]
MGLPALAADRISEAGPLSEFQVLRIELKEKVLPFNVGTLFKNHQLPKTQKDIDLVKKAYSIGVEKLENGEGIKAVPYLAYAESYWLPESLRYLDNIQSGRYENIPDNVRKEIKKAFPTLNIAKLHRKYEGFWEPNVKDLRSQQNSSMLAYVRKFIFGDGNPSFPNAKPMESISSEELFPEQRKNSPARENSPYSSDSSDSREGTVEDITPLLPGDHHGKKIKKD